MATSGQERGDTTRAAILAAAQDLFLRQGYHATSVRQIATVAGIVPGAVYNHFPSKQEIHLALLRQVDVYAAIGKALAAATGDSAEALLRDGAHRLVAALRSQDDSVRLLFVDVLEFGARNISALASEAMPHMIAFFGRVIATDRGQELKAIRLDVLGRAFIGLFLSNVIMTRFYGDALSGVPMLDVDADVVDDFLAIFLHGVMRHSNLHS